MRLVIRYTTSHIATFMSSIDMIDLSLASVLSLTKFLTALACLPTLCVQTILCRSDYFTSTLHDNKLPLQCN